MDGIHSRVVHVREWRLLLLLCAMEGNRPNDLPLRFGCAAPRATDKHACTAGQLFLMRGADTTAEMQNTEISAPVIEAWCGGARGNSATKPSPQIRGTRRRQNKIAAGAVGGGKVKSAASFLGGQAGGQHPPTCAYIAGFLERRPLLLASTILARERR